MKTIDWKGDLLQALIAIGVITAYEALKLKESYDFVENFLPVLATILVMYLVRFVFLFFRR